MIATAPRVAPPKQSGFPRALVKQGACFRNGRNEISLNLITKEHPLRLGSRLHMNNKLNPSSRPSCKRLLLPALLASCVLTATLGTYKAAAGQQTEAAVLANANAAAGNAQNELILAQGKKLEAERRLEEIENFSIFREPDASSLTSLRQLADTVGNMFNPAADKPRLQDQLKDSQTKLAAATEKLKAAQKDLESATSDDKIEAAKTAVQRKLDDAAAITPELGALVTKLDTALAAIYGRVANLATAADNALKPFAQPPAEAPAIRNLFQQKLADVAAMMQFQVDLQARWEGLSAALQKVVDDHATKDDPVNNALGKLKQSVETVAQNISTPITSLATLAQTRNDELFVKSEDFKKDPARQESRAVAGIKEAQGLAEALEKINRNAESISAQAEFQGITFDQTTTANARQALTTNVNQLKRQAAAFQELLSGDRSLWVTEKIRLYYFTDVPRLMQTLNPDATLTGGDVDARRRANERLQKLRDAEDAQSEANGAVLSLKKRVNTIKQDLDQAKLDLNAATILAQAATAKNAELDRRPAGSVPAERKARVLEDKNKRDQELAAAQGRADKLNDESNGLAAQLREAEAQLDTAQAAFERASNVTIRAAQVESAAFANARDNAPFWFAQGISTSTDPARRVDITSSTNGENAIFIRGRREDIIKVQDIIAKLDEPAPQARMTLWKIELNSDATQKGADKFNKALPIVEDELAHTREKIANALNRLLEAVSLEAEKAAAREREVDGDLKAYDPDFEVGHRYDCEERERYAKYKFPLDPEDTDISGRQQRLRRYSLYSPEVRKELGIQFIDQLGFDNPKQFGLKDPATATTLNEAVIIMLLTDRVHRSNIMANFEDALKQDLNRYGTDEEKRALADKKGVYFRRLRAMMGIDSKREGDNELETTRQQQELIYAMRGPLLRHLIGRIVGLQERVRLFLEVNPAARPDLYHCLQKKLPKIFDTIHDEFPISAVDIIDGKVKLVESGEGTIGLEVNPIGTKVYNLRPSPARVAAADGMLDIFTKAFEDDIDREFIQPMLTNLRTRLSKTGIGFGVIQRTSVLATNRLVARVDPRATAELSVGQETNLLQSLQSISQITLAAQTGNVLGALGQLRASANEKDTAEIFGITSGSAFQVTPIFDPTGQALRFKFDFVDTTLVREPRGTTNPRTPRVERHTVNTEVQLANLEIREVSRFESDAKVGIPTTYRGGLPILKDIPGVRPIPLIGWFIRRSGSNAIAQRSLIFAQTTMSPTIGDILELFDTSLQRR